MTGIGSAIDAARGEGHRDASAAGDGSVDAGSAADARNAGPAGAAAGETADVEIGRAHV